MKLLAKSRRGGTIYADEAEEPGYVRFTPSSDLAYMTAETFDRIRRDEEAGRAYVNARAEAKRKGQIVKVKVVPVFNGQMPMPRLPLSAEEIRPKVTTLVQQMSALARARSATPGQVEAFTHRYVEISNAVDALRRELLECEGMLEVAAEQLRAFNE